MMVRPRQTGRDLSFVVLRRARFVPRARFFGCSIAGTFALILVLVSTSNALSQSIQVSPQAPPQVALAAGVSPFAEGDTLHLSTVSGCEAGPSNGRFGVALDSLVFELCEGTWSPPDLEGSPEWSRFDADEDGWIQDSSLAGGYAFATVDCAVAGVYLLEGQGWRHLYVNGVLQIGDVYHRGFLRRPIRLREGVNELLFKEGWGAIAAQIYPASAPIFVEELDSTLPSIVREEGSDRMYHAGVVVTNATDAWLKGIQLVGEVTAPAKSPLASPIATCSLPPLTSRKVPLSFYVPPHLLGADTDSLDLRVTLTGPGVDPAAAVFSLDVVSQNDKHYRSFVSQIDGSVQHYGVTPPPEEPDSSVGLVLTLHGAGVPARQAHHYAARDWAYIVSPTNRREFGFDWEDWGRLDALEVLDHSSALFETDPRRTWLTGHSMGGHGTWSIGAHYPDRFAAIAPSAGWRDFDSYSRRPAPESVSAIAEMFHRAANASRPLLLETNYLQSGIYILHGDADDNVPVEQARFMRERLAKFHPDFAYFEKESAGHWWGDQCMDWPPLMNFLRRHELPERTNTLAFEFATISPRVSSSCHWLTVESQEKCMELSTVMASVEADTVRLLLSNVDRFVIADPFRDVEPKDDEPQGADSDGEKVDAGESQGDGSDERPAIPWDQYTCVVNGVSVGTVGAGRFELSGGQWQEVNSALHKKGPHRSGPFKEAFRNRALLICGTQGNAEETSWAEAKARFDAETFYYRGNGAFEILRDFEFRAEEHPDRNIILYGNSETNSAWTQVLSADCPMQITRESVRLPEQEFEGDDLACLFVYPRKDSDSSSVGVVGGTGRPGLFATNTLPYFVSGVGYPDWTVLQSKMWVAGEDGVLATGFFDGDWRLGEDAVYR